MRTAWLSILIVFLTASNALAQRDAPVWEAYLPQFSIYHDNTNPPAITIEFLFKKNGGPHEHVEHQAYVLLYLKKDEEEILKLAADPELTKKKNEKTKLFLDLLVEKKLIVSLDSQVAKINRTPRFPDVKGNPKPETTAATLAEFAFAFKFTFTYETLFQSAQKLANFNLENVNLVGREKWFNDRFKLIVFVPVNDSAHATKVSPKIHEMYDFANGMNFSTALLYFRPLPYEFGFKKYEDTTLIYIN
jgi:hypothetical protein